VITRSRYMPTFTSKATVKSIGRLVRIFFDHNVRAGMTVLQAIHRIQKGA